MTSRLASLPSANDARPLRSAGPLHWAEHTRACLALLRDVASRLQIFDGLDDISVPLLRHVIQQECQLMSELDHLLVSLLPLAGRVRESNCNLTQVLHQLLAPVSQLLTSASSPTSISLTTLLPSGHAGFLQPQDYTRAAGSDNATGPGQEAEAHTLPRRVPPRPLHAAPSTSLSTKCTRPTRLRLALLAGIGRPCATGQH